MQYDAQIAQFEPLVGWTPTQPIVDFRSTGQGLRVDKNVCNGMLFDTLDLTSCASFFFISDESFTT